MLNAMITTKYSSKESFNIMIKKEHKKMLVLEIFYYYIDIFKNYWNSSNETDLQQ